MLLDICIFIFGEEGNSSGQNVHYIFFSQCQLLISSNFTRFLTRLATHRYKNYMKILTVNKKFMLAGKDMSLLQFKNSNNLTRLYLQRKFAPNK